MVGVTDIGGNVVYRFEHSTYGEIFEVNSNNELDEFTDFEEIVYGFQGRRLDSETNGLMYFRNRYYNLKLGHWLQRDPLGYVDSLGLYFFYTVLLKLELQRDRVAQRIYCSKD